MSQEQIDGSPSQIKKVLPVSYKTQHGLNEDPKHNETDHMNDSMNQRYNTMNQALQQIQPQSKIRGQRRHFQNNQNEFDLLF